jgi:hypothetical protein
VTEGPNPETVGALAAEHLGPILYALEACALQMEQAARQEEAAYFRALARRLADAGGQPREESGP